ncbi:MAG: hypothetical protein U0939_22770 [Pirellulales bacterium]
MAKRTVSPEARQQKLERVEQLLERLQSVNPATLDRKAELSAKINFEPAVPHLTEMLDIVKQLADRDLSRLPSQQLDEINSGATHLNNLITQVLQFDLNTNTPADACNTIINNIKQSYDAVMTPLVIPLAFTATQATDYPKLEREAKGCLTTMKDESAKLQSHLTEARAQSDAALAAVKAQAAEAGVATNAHIFASNAVSHATVASLWLKATLAAGCVTLAAATAGVIIAITYTPSTTQAAIQYVVAKVILLSMLSFVLVWCSRNYRAHKHNETLNQHRANALMTFRAFVEGTSDEAVKDALLLHAAQAAFAPRPTAFDTNEADHPPINPVVEVLGKALTKGST